MRQLVEDARKLIRTHSVTAAGNEEVANFFESLLQRRGIKVQLQQVTHSQESLSKRQFNVVGILGDPLVDRKTRKGLLLLSHLDTGGPGLKENWVQPSQDPFSGAIHEGKVYGVGAVSGKLDLLCKIKAAEKFREKKLKQPIYLVGTCGEQAGMFGVKYLIKSMALNPKQVLVGGPTSLRIVNTHKQMALFKVAFEYQSVEKDAKGFNRKIDLHSYGRSAHGACPAQGVNALVQSQVFLKKASEAGFDLRFTRFEGGEAFNRVPDKVRVEFYLTSQQFEDFKRFFREYIRQAGFEKAFRVELGGLGETGVKFLPAPLFSALSDVMDFLEEVRSEWLNQKDDDFDPSYTSLNIAQVWQRPTGQDLYFDWRSFPGQSVEEVETKLRQGIQAIASRFPSLKIDLIRERLNPALQADDQADFTSLCGEALEAAGLTPSVGTSAHSSEAAWYAQAGYSALVFGPGDLIGNSLSANEFVKVEDLEKAIHFYEKLIEKTCL